MVILRAKVQAYEATRSDRVHEDQGQRKQAGGATQSPVRDPGQRVDGRYGQEHASENRAEEKKSRVTREAEKELRAGAGRSRHCHQGPEGEREQERAVIFTG